MTVVQYVAGLMLLAWIVVTIDTRYFNIPSSNRLRWPQLIAFWKDPRLDIPYDPPPSVLPIMDGFWNSDLKSLRDCLLTEEKPANDAEHVALVSGSRMILVDDQINWPNYYFAGNALRPTQNLGIRPDLSRYRFVIVPKAFVSELPVKFAGDATIQKLQQIWSHAQPICESPALQIFRIDRVQ